MIKRLLMILLGLLLLTGCEASKVQIDSLIETTKDKLIAPHVLPQYVLEKTKPRIAVLELPLSRSNITAFEPCFLQQYLVEQVQLLFSDAYHPIAHAQLEGLTHAIDVAEESVSYMSLKDHQTWAESLDYVLVGSVSEAQLKSETSKGEKQGASPICHEKVKVTVQMAVISLALPNRSSKFEDVMEASGVYRDDEPRACHEQESCDALKRAVDQAVDELKENIMNAAPVYGYIKKIQSDLTSRAALLSLGKNNGLKSGMMLDIVQFESADTLEEHAKQGKRVLARCKVDEKDLSDQQAWCVVEGELAGEVKVKHAVVFRHEKTLLRKFESGMNWLEYTTF